MDSLFFPEEYLLTSKIEDNSIVPLLERALEYVQRERLAEAIAFLTLARERLSPAQIQLAALLDVFIESYFSYERAQHNLQEASRHFSAAYIEQQARVSDFEKVLPALIRDVYTSCTSPSRFLDLRNQQVAQLPSQPVRSAQEFPSSLAHQVSTENSCSLPDLYITCFGHFEVRRSGKAVALCSSRNGRSILRYLVVQPERCTAGDTLQALLWPEDEPEVAQNKLHIAISALRRSLNHGYACAPSGGYILCKNGVYHLNSAISIHTDLDEFLQCYQAGRRANEGRVALYERACRLYVGPFLAEDLYSDWSFIQREQLCQIYFAMCRVLADHYLKHEYYEDAAKWATAMLKENHCDEAAHRQLMQIYAVQGRRSEALQQYQRCERILREELGVQLLPETVLLFKTLLSD